MLALALTRADGRHNFAAPWQQTGAKHQQRGTCFVGYMARWRHFADARGTFAMEDTACTRIAPCTPGHPHLHAQVLILPACLLGACRDSSAAAVAAAAAAAAASATAPALQPARRNMLLVDGSRHSSPTGSEPNSNTPLGDASDTWMMPDGKPAARPRHRLDLNSVSLALKPESGVWA